MLNLKIYCARPITGLSYQEVSEYYMNLTVILNHIGYTTYHPMCGKKKLNEQTGNLTDGYTLPVSKDHAIFERDKWMVKQSDVLYANLIGAQKISIGTMMELAWAFDAGKHVVIAMDEPNPHQHPFVREAAHIMLGTHEEALEYLIKLIKQEI